MTWVDVAADAEFTIENLPYGVFSHGEHAPRVGVAIGDRVLDLAPALDEAEFAQGSLNAFMARGRDHWMLVRSRIVDVLTTEAGRRRAEAHLVDAAAVRMHLPFVVADYVDFYSSLEHAQNLGRI